MSVTAPALSVLGALITRFRAHGTALALAAATLVIGLVAVVQVARADESASLIDTVGISALYAAKYAAEYAAVFAESGGWSHAPTGWPDPRGLRRRSVPSPRASAPRANAWHAAPDHCGTGGPGEVRHRSDAVRRGAHDPPPQR